MDAVVMAAGEGTRLRPLTEQWPKAVLPIDGRPVLAVLLRELAAADLRRVWVVTGYLAEQVERLAGDGSAFGLELSFVRQPGVLGSAVAERLCLDKPPYELEHAFQSAIEAGETVIAVEIGKTHDLTYPLDLVEE